MVLLGQKLPQDLLHSVIYALEYPEIVMKYVGKCLEVITNYQFFISSLKMSVFLIQCKKISSADYIFFHFGDFWSPFVILHDFFQMFFCDFIFGGFWSILVILGHFCYFGEFWSPFVIFL